MIVADDIVKLVLAFSVALVIVMIGYQVAKLVGEVAGLVKDMRRPVQTMGALSDELLSDYKRIRKLLDWLVNIQNEVFKPLRRVVGIFMPPDISTNGDNQTAAAPMEQAKQSVPQQE